MGITEKDLQAWHQFNEIEKNQYNNDVNVYSAFMQKKREKQKDLIVNISGETTNYQACDGCSS